MARVLQDRGVKPTDLIAVHLQRSPECIASLLAIWKVGAAYLPLDAAIPPQRLRFLLEDSGAGLLVTQLDSVGVKELPTNRVVIWNDVTLAVEGKPDTVLPVSQTDRAYVIYTSGSTGQPKGVVIS